MSTPKTPKPPPTFRLTIPPASLRPRERMIALVTWYEGRGGDWFIEFDLLKPSAVVTFANEHDKDVCPGEWL
jgi:hypothetical protein